MKNYLILLLVVVLALGLVACGNKTEAEAPSANESATEPTSEETQTPDDPSGAVGAEESPNDVEITLPAVIFKNENELVKGGLYFGDDLQDYIQENDFIDAKWNENGSLTITMTDERLEGYKAAKAQIVEDTIKIFIDGSYYPYVKSYESTPDFKTVTIYADKKEYKSNAISSAFIPINTGLAVGIYRQYVGEDDVYSIIISDADTGEQFAGRDYPAN
jgi:predicted small lipoprotein YifL